MSKIAVFLLTIILAITSLNFYYTAKNQKLELDAINAQLIILDEKMDDLNVGVRNNNDEIKNLNDKLETIYAE